MFSATLQTKYNTHRLPATSRAIPQSGTFFKIWHRKGLFAALRWFYNFKRNVQGLKFAGLRVICDLLGSTLVASGLVKFKIIAIIAVLLMVSLGGTGDVVVEDGGKG